MSQIDTENDKNLKIFQFSKFLRIFVKISTIFLNWNVLKGQKETFCCLVGFFEEVIAVFFMNKFPIGTENHKNPTIFYISKILCIFSKFSTVFMDWKIK